MEKEVEFINPFGIYLRNKIFIYPNEFGNYWLITKIDKINIIKTRNYKLNIYFFISGFIFLFISFILNIAYCLKFLYILPLFMILVSLLIHNKEYILNVYSYESKEQYVIPTNLKDDAKEFVHFITKQLINISALNSRI